MDREIAIRRARPEEAAALTDLIVRSKAYWGYEATSLEAWRTELTLGAETVRSHPTYVAEDAATGTMLGVTRFYPLDPLDATVVYLDDLFIDPAAIRQGVGTRLWHFVVEQARAMGSRTLTLDADPNARPFYERMGAVVESWHETSIPGRLAPRMRYDLPAQ